MATLLWLPLVFGAAALPLRDAPEKLAPWTTALRDRQPEDAFAAVYRLGRKRLVFIAAQHANRSDSLTFKLINDAYNNFRFDTVIAEGFATSKGPNPASVLKYAAENGPDKDGFVAGGETFPTVTGAKRKGATLWGGEADDLAIKERLSTVGVSGTDLLGFYVLRNIPQWIRERKIENGSDPHLGALVADALARNRQKLQLEPTVLPGFPDWAVWYQAMNGRRIGSDFITEEVGPLADGKFGTNRIAYAISRQRDAFLHHQVISHLNAGENVLVVFGASHLLIQRPALDAVLGSPCYVGTNLQHAEHACR